ncbi:MAG: hypothetical protein IJR85_10395, partial [Synergistaceae bacterium]|nr:hypothetical protein [Synergistaceae bacterium]
VAWKRPGGTDCVTVFQTKLNASKQFDGFDDGKLVVAEPKTGGTWRGLIAADIAGEGVELDKPTHLKKKSNRSYIAALSAVPYHVDNVSSDGSALTEQPTNFTYSDAMNGGNMTVSYGKSTTDSTTNTVKQDLSQSIETVFAADPTGTDQSVQGTLGAVKGLTAFASAIGDIAHGIKVDNMSPEERQNAVWKPSSPTEGLTDMIEFFTDKVESIDQRSNTESSTTVIDKNITATTHDAILYTDTARHIWRYPVMTRPLPMWLAWGPRVDSTPIDNPSSVQGDKELFLTFTMSENAPLHTSSSITDSMYQPLHEEGNFFSYPSQIADVEGYNESGLLADEDTWEFSSVADTTGITFTKATSNMQHTEKTVTPSTFTTITNVVDRLVNGKNAGGVNVPDSENPKTFSKEYSKTERISYSLQGSSTLTAMQAADHTVKMQPFVAKEGAMTLAAAVELSSTNHARLWEPGSIYQQKPDPALLLPQKFVKDGAAFRANTYDKSAMKIRGIRFYVPDFAFYSDNRLLNGLKYEIRVPMYNASFKDTGSFNVRLSWANDNSPTAQKTPIGTVSMTLGGWKNEGNNNKGTAVFEWTPNLTPGRQYYFYVEIDPDNALDEVHEARYEADNTTIRDWGGNNTGFYPFYAFDKDDLNVSSSGFVSVSNAWNFYAAEDDEIQLTTLSFTDEDGKAITDMAAFIDACSDDSFVPITANFTNTGPEVPYAFFVGYVLTPSGKAKLPNASINTIVDLSELESSDIEDVFMINDFALLSGQNQVTFAVSPADILASADEVAAAADYMTFGVIAITEEDLEELAEEFYAGEDPFFELEELASYLVSNDTTGTYVLSTDEPVFWNISGVKLNETVSASDEDDDAESDDRYFLDIGLETIVSLEDPSEDEEAPSNYGRIAIVTVSSIAGYTPKGVYEITVQKLAYDDDDDVWTNAGVLTFNTELSGDQSSNTAIPDNGNNGNQGGNNGTPSNGNGGSNGNSGGNNGNNGNQGGNNESPANGGNDTPTTPDTPAPVPGGAEVPSTAITEAPEVADVFTSNPAVFGLVLQALNLSAGTVLLDNNAITSGQTASTEAVQAALSSLTNQFSNVASLVIALRFPSMTSLTPGVAVFGITEQVAAYRGRKMSFLMIPKGRAGGTGFSAAAEAEVQVGKFVNAQGEVVDTIPAEGDVSVSAFMEGGVEYDPVAVEGELVPAAPSNGDNNETPTNGNNNTPADNNGGNSETPANGNNETPTDSNGGNSETPTNGNGNNETPANGNNNQTPTNDYTDDDLSSSGGGCNSGFGFGTLAFLVMALRRKSRS